LLNIVNFTRVGSVKGSPTIRGNTGIRRYRQVGTVTSDVMAI